LNYLIVRNWSQSTILLTFDCD